MPPRLRSIVVAALRTRKIEHGRKSAIFQDGKRKARPPVALIVARSRKSRTRNITAQDALPADLYDYARPPARRTGGGGYRRDYLRALAQRVEVDAQELRIMGSKSELLRTLVAASSAKTAGFGVPSSVPKWRTRHDSNVWPSPSEGDALSS